MSASTAVCCECKDLSSHNATNIQTSHASSNQTPTQLNISLLPTAVRKFNPIILGQK